MDFIKKPLEFLLAIALFIPVTFEAIFAKAELKAGDIVLTWGIVIAFLISSYLVIHINYFHVRFTLQEKFTKGIIFLAIFSFVPTLIIAGGTDNVVYFPWTWVMAGSLGGMYLLPAILLIELVMIPIVYDAYQECKETMSLKVSQKLFKKLRLWFKGRT